MRSSCCTVPFSQCLGSDFLLREACCTAVRAGGLAWGRSMGLIGLVALYVVLRLQLVVEQSVM